MSTLKVEPWELKANPRQRANIAKVKANKYYNELISMGLEPFTKEWKKAYDKLKYTNEKSDPDYIKRKSASKRNWYHNNLERARTSERTRKKRRIEKQGERINELARERYKRHRHVEATKQRLRRYEREPNRAIRTATDLYLKGLLDGEQYNQRVTEYIEKAKRLTGPRRRPGQRRGQDKLAAQCGPHGQAECSRDCSTGSSEG